MLVPEHGGEASHKELRSDRPCQLKSKAGNIATKSSKLQMRCCCSLLWLGLTAGPKRTIICPHIFWIVVKKRGAESRGGILRAQSNGKRKAPAQSGKPRKQQNNGQTHHHIGWKQEIRNSCLKDICRSFRQTPRRQPHREELMSNVDCKLLKSNHSSPPGSLQIFLPFLIVSAGGCLSSSGKPPLAKIMSN